jgi:ABC-type phosphate transport system substrate-binding protein
MRIKPWFRFLLLSMGCASALAHAELYIICNSTLQIDSGEVKEIFKGDKTFSGSTKLVPVDNAAAQDAFLSMMGMEASRYNTIWTKKSFREGLIPPTVKAGDIEVIEFVRKTPGSIGYVSTPPATGVTVIRKY